MFGSLGYCVPKEIEPAHAKKNLLLAYWSKKHEIAYLWWVLA